MGQFYTEMMDYHFVDGHRLFSERIGKILEIICQILFEEMFI